MKCRLLAERCHGCATLDESVACEFQSFRPSLTTLALSVLLAAHPPRFDTPVCRHVTFFVANLLSSGGSSRKEGFILKEKRRKHTKVCYTPTALCSLTVGSKFLLHWSVISGECSWCHGIKGQGRIDWSRHKNFPATPDLESTVLRG